MGKLDDLIERLETKAAELRALIQEAKGGLGEQDDPYDGIPEIMAFTGRGEHSIRSAIRAGRLSASVGPRGRYEVRHSEVVRWMESKKPRRPRSPEWADDEAERERQFLRLTKGVA